MAIHQGRVYPCAIREVTKGATRSDFLQYLKYKGTIGYPPGELSGVPKGIYSPRFLLGLSYEGRATQIGDIRQGVWHPSFLLGLSVCRGKLLHGDVVREEVDDTALVFRLVSGEGAGFSCLTDIRMLITRGFSTDTDVFLSICRTIETRSDIRLTVISNVSKQADVVLIIRQDTDDPGNSSQTAMSNDWALEFLGKGLRFPFAFQRRSGGTQISTATSSDHAHIHESIRQILGTKKGERFMRPEFGTRLHELIFEPNDRLLYGLIRHEVMEALDQWEPRVIVTDVLVGSDDTDGHLVLVNIRYRLISSQVEGNVVWPFYRELE